VKKILEYVHDGKHVSPKLSPGTRRFLAQRDCALIAMLWLFGKRISEILKLRIKDVWEENGELRVKFMIEKKAKTYKLCECKALNSKTASYCKQCGKSLENAPLKTTKAGEATMVKRKSLLVEPVFYITFWRGEWLKRVRDVSAFLFPTLVVRHTATGMKVMVNPWRPISRQRAHQLLAMFGLSPHLFRSAFAKRLLRKTKNIKLIQSAGDWSSISSLLEYARSLGETPEDEQFSQLE